MLFVEECREDIWPVRKLATPYLIVKKNKKLTHMLTFRCLHMNY